MFLHDIYIYIKPTVLYVYIIYICNSRLLLLFNSKTRKQKQQNSGKTQKTSLSSKPSVLPKVLLLFCFCSSKMLGLELKTVVFWVALFFLLHPEKQRNVSFVLMTNQSINQSINTDLRCLCFFQHFRFGFLIFKVQKTLKKHVVYSV